MTEFSYLFIGVFATLNANGLSDSLALRVGMILELILHTGTILEVRWEVNTFWEGLSRGSVGCISVSLAIDVFTCNAWNVASITCSKEILEGIYFT